MFVVTSDVHATTHQHYALEVVQKPAVFAGTAAHRRPYTKVDTGQVIATATKATIHGVGVQVAAIQ